MEKFNRDREKNEFLNSYPKKIVQEVELAPIDQNLQNSGKLEQHQESGVAITIQNIIKGIDNKVAGAIPKDETEKLKLGIELRTAYHNGTEAVKKLTAENLRDPLTQYYFNAYLNMCKYYAGDRVLISPIPNLRDRAQDENIVDQVVATTAELCTNSGFFKQGIDDALVKYKDNIKTQSQRETLYEIKALIETHPWQLGTWGSSSSIKVGTESRPIPRNMKKIYDKIELVEKGELDPETALKEIGEIASQALTSKTRFFKDSRIRDPETTDAYKELAKLAPGNN